MEFATTWNRFRRLGTETILVQSQSHPPFASQKAFREELGTYCIEQINDLERMWATRLSQLDKNYSDQR